MPAFFSRPPRSTRRRRRPGLLVWAGIFASFLPIAGAEEIRLLRAKPDPYGCPRPAPGETNVPVGTSFFLEIGFEEKNTTDVVLPDSVAVRIGPRGQPAADVLKAGGQFAEGYSGKVFPGRKDGLSLVVYLDGEADLEPSTTYVVSVTARSRDGAVLDGKQGSWQFTTEDAATTHSLRFQLDLSTPPICWHGGFFRGFCKPSFCTSASNRIPGYELMDRIRTRCPKAWSLQRDFTLTGMEHQPRFLSGRLPNVVRERETRRITAMETQDESVLLRVEDFFGHQQYGIASNRPLSDDYHPGDEVLIADGQSHAMAIVLAVVENSPEDSSKVKDQPKNNLPLPSGERAGVRGSHPSGQRAGARGSRHGKSGNHSSADPKSLLVTSFEEPTGGWKIEYAGPLPEKEDPNAPGLFPPGGCYLRKFRPPGTPHYYWGRVDKEWDIAERRFRRRLVVNFTDAPGDLSVDGRNFTFPKDYAEYHRVVHAITTHLIRRYGDACLDFVWSVFNEPDLAVAFWRSGDWNELQKFYDYTVDAVLRAFEDHGYDSNRVMVGGLEIGAIFGAHIERPVLGIFLAHCSPSAARPGALTYNAAVADKRLDGKRSKRVEDLCRASGGKGSPCDFVSIHSYNASEITAAKLIRAKQIALETDPEYYADLWVNSFESCPDWAPPPDVAAADSYLGNGYFPTWCADVTRRQLAKAADDARYAFGETVLTFWPWPNSNFRGHNNATRVIAVDENGDGKKDRQETVAMPILNFLGLVAGMGNAYQVLPEHAVGGHVVSGFASTGEDAVRILLYSHHGRDIQSRSKAAFEIALELDALPWREVHVSEYRFDKDNNSYYHLARQLRDRPAGAPDSRTPDPKEVQKLIADLASSDRGVQIAAVKKAASFSDIPQGVVIAAIRLYEETEHEEVRAAIRQVVQQIQTADVCYRPEEVARVRALSVLQVTKESSHAVDAHGTLRLPLTVAANGANFVVIESRAKP